jgi:hypothetical protein
LGVRVGRISLRPRLAGERIQLGFVPVAQTGTVRASLIGVAPLLSGCGVILLIGYTVFGLDGLGTALANLNWSGLRAGLQEIARAPDAWVWFYVIFAVSNTMLPSRSDRQSWTPVILFLALVGLAVWVSGLGPAVAETVEKPAVTAVRWLAATTTLTLLVDAPFIALIAIAERLAGRLRGTAVRYGR